MRRSNCASALQYGPELTWNLCLRILDAQEARDQEKAEAVGATFRPALRTPYRWRGWAAPWSDTPGQPKAPEGRPFGWRRLELFATGAGQHFFSLSQLYEGLLLKVGDKYRIQAEAEPYEIMLE